MNPVTQLLGLAMRAKCVVTGEERVVQSIRAGKAKLVFVAKDGGKRTKKKLFDKANTYGVPLIDHLNRTTLGHAVGKGERVAVAVIEPGFAAKLLDLSKRYFGGEVYGEKNENIRIRQAAQHDE